MREAMPCAPQKTRFEFCYRVAISFKNQVTMFRPQFATRLQIFANLGFRVLEEFFLYVAEGIMDQDHTF